MTNFAVGVDEHGGQVGDLEARTRGFATADLTGPTTNYQTFGQLLRNVKQLCGGTPYPSKGPSVGATTTRSPVVDSNGLDLYAGIYPNSKGGTELMYNGLLARLDASLADRFQIICSRVRKFRAGQIPVLYLHDLAEDPENHHLGLKASIDRFAAFVFVSHTQMQEFRLRYPLLPEGKCHVIRNAIEPIELVEKATHEQVNLIYHTTPHRGLNVLLTVFQRLASEFPKLHLDVYSSFSIYGWAQRDAAFQGLFDICKHHPQITYHGAVPNAEVRTALQKAHIFAYPSIWKETSCLCMLEAMSAGVFPVYGAYGALPETTGGLGVEVARHEDAGVYASRFYQALHPVVQLYHEHPKWFEGPLRLGKEFIDTTHNWETVAAKWTMLLNALAQGSEK